MMRKSNYLLDYRPPPATMMRKNNYLLDYCPGIHHFNPRVKLFNIPLAISGCLAHPPAVQLQYATACLSDEHQRYLQHTETIPIKGNRQGILEFIFLILLVID